MQVVLGPLPYAVICMALTWVFGATLAAAGKEAIGLGVFVYPLPVFLSSALFALRKEVRSEWSSGYRILLGCAIISVWLVVIGCVQVVAMGLLARNLEAVWKLFFTFPRWLLGLSYQTGAALLAGILVLAITRRKRPAKAG